MPVVKPRIRVALAQVNPTVGAIEANAEMVANAIGRARTDGAHLVVLPELVLTGYPPEDLLLKKHFVDASRAALAEIAEGVDDIVALVGYPRRGAALHNSLAVLSEGEVRASYDKTLLPNYGVFDERRYFEPGRGAALIEINGIAIGLTICEDIWFPGPPTSSAALAGAALVVNPSASPYHRGKGAEREAMVADRARESEVVLALCNLVGGQDELVFDGHSVVVDPSGKALARAGQFSEELLLCDLELTPADTGERHESPGLVDVPVLASVTIDRTPSEPPPERLATALTDPAEVYEALKLGLGDYFRKNGFTHAVLGLSGGIDSALVALLAADALGPGRVSCVVMPSPHSSDATQGDARRIAENLGCECIEIAIEPVMAAYEAALADRFDGTEPGIAEENLQARIRGNLVMALSNKFGWLPLSTGNKSEMSVGYATLYGDMAGGFAVLKDVPKGLVYALVHHRNEADPAGPIPASVLERPPSAELRPDQLDSDSLPDYDTLDAALAAYVERDLGREQLIAAGIDAETADRVIGLVDRAEYKRRQTPPGVKITTKAFGRDRRLPITNRFGG